MRLPATLPVRGTGVVLLLALALACDGSTAPPPQPAAIAATTTLTPTGTVGAPVSPPPAVRVTDASGKPLARTAVTFAVVAGEGSVTAAAGASPVQSVSVSTDAQGVAALYAWTLGTTAGPQAVTATVASLEPIRFSAAAQPGPVARLVLVSGDTQTDTVRATLPQPLGVRALDPHGNVVPGAGVRFVADRGTVTPAQPTTDGDGLAQASWTLDTTTGPASVRAELVGRETIALVLTATVEWPRLSATAIALGGDFGCALTPEGRTFCWGGNAHGQIGDGTTVARTVARQVAGAPAFRQIAAGGSHACGLTDDGVIHCWGWNHWGQLGDGTTTSRAVPRPVGTALRFVEVAAVGGRTCGRTASGEVFCWGFLVGTTAALGVAVNQVSGATPFAALSTRAEQLCGITVAGATQCFAGTHAPELGLGTYMWRPQPAPSWPALTSITGGFAHHCGLTSVGAALCWGDGDYGALGTGLTDDAPAPVPVVGNHVFASLHGGWDWTCGIKADGSLWCWGNDSSGLLGLPPRPARHAPSRIPLPAGVALQTMDTGFQHQCVIATSRRVYCWGVNTAGQLGDGAQPGTPVGRSTPGLVLRREVATP